MPWTASVVMLTVLSFGRTTVTDERITNLGHRIRELRKERGITQEGLAALAGIDRGYMGHIERGSRNISVVKILAIADALSVGPAALFEPPGTGDASARPSR